MRVLSLCVLPVFVSIILSAPVPPPKDRSLTILDVAGTYQYRQEGWKYVCTITLWDSGIYQCHFWNDNLTSVYVGKWKLNADKIEIEEWLSTDPKAHIDSSGSKFSFVYRRNKSMKLFSGTLIKKS